jgi:hypothetical protein
MDRLKTSKITFTCLTVLPSNDYWSRQKGVSRSERLTLNDERDAYLRYPLLGFEWDE